MKVGKLMDNHILYTTELLCTYYHSLGILKAKNNGNASAKIFKVSRIKITIQHNNIDLPTYFLSEQKWNGI